MLGNNPNVHQKEEWINKKVVCPYNRVLFSHTKESCLIHAAVWMNLKDNMPTETSQIRKDKFCMISRMSRIGKFIETVSH